MPEINLPTAMKQDEIYALLNQTYAELANSFDELQYQKGIITWRTDVSNNTNGWKQILEINGKGFLHNFQLALEGNEGWRITIDGIVILELIAKKSLTTSGAAAFYSKTSIYPVLDSGLTFRTKGASTSIVPSAYGNAFVTEKPLKFDTNLKIEAIRNSQYTWGAYAEYSLI